MTMGDNDIIKVEGIAIPRLKCVDNFIITFVAECPDRQPAFYLIGTKAIIR